MKHFHLPLLAALPAMLSACSSPSAAQDDYTRRAYATREECLRDNQAYLQQGMAEPCTQRPAATGGYYGPWFMYFGTLGGGRVVGYDANGSTSRTGYSVDSNGRLGGKFRAPKISRGGFSTGTRSSASSSAGRSGSIGG